MKVTVYRTGHQIADTVANALIAGFGNVAHSDIGIGYGILRGMDDNLRKHKHWFNVDNGYWGAGHFHGNYRISYKGTQAKYSDLFPSAQANIELTPKYEGGEYVMICPPTLPVCEFFGIDGEQWLKNAVSMCYKRGLPCFVRTKDERLPLEEQFKSTKLVITFNSSVGWKALQHGIPCLSDTQHSVVGSYYNTKCIDNIFSLFNTMPREKLFNLMGGHQFTLNNIKRGDAWGLIEYYCNQGQSNGSEHIHRP